MSSISGKTLFWISLAAQICSGQLIHLNQTDLGEIVRDMMPVVRAGFRGQRIPSEDGDPVVAVDISKNMNLPADTKVFGVKLNSLKIRRGQLRNKSIQPCRLRQTVNRLVAAGSAGKGKNPLPRYQ